MVKQVLFIQGAGEGAYDEDKVLADYLKNGLGAEYNFTYPKFSGLENVDYDAWKTQIGSELEGFGNGGIIVTHSLGGPALLKYLSEESIPLSIGGLFLIAAPYKCTDGEWGTDDFALDVNFGASLPEVQHLALYHSRDDEWVPFSHLTDWAEKLPQAILREFEDRGHSFSGSKFLELVGDIQKCQSDKTGDR